jgi:hypothetical protein
MVNYRQGQWVFVFNIQNGFRTLGILTSHNGLFCVQNVTGLVHKVYIQVPHLKMCGYLSP